LEPIRIQYKLKLYAAHFNHMLRGRASLSDAKFAEKLCAERNIPFFCGKKDIRLVSRAKKGGLEKNARIERYRFLLKCAHKAKAKKIAAGHNLDDNAETVLMRLLAGSGSAGLSGIADIRDISPEEFGLRLPRGAEKKFTLIRPLSGASKPEILKYVKNNGVHYAVDGSNSENIYTRNRVRNWLIPAIEKEFNPRVKDALASTGAILAVENSYMEAAAKDAFSATVVLTKKNARINLGRFLKYHIAIRRRIVLSALKAVLKSGRRAGYDEVEAVLDCALSGSTSQLPEGFLCSVKGGTLVIARAAAGKAGKRARVNSPDGTNAAFNGYEFSFETSDNTGSLDFSDKDTAYADLEKVRFPLTVRFRKNGEKFIPYGMDREVRLKKFFNTCHLPEGTPVVADKEKVVWVSGGRIDNRVRLTRATKRVLIIGKKEPNGPRGR
jgi:tRNA(Ile)-lysidine synthase